MSQIQKMMADAFAAGQAKTSGNYAVIINEDGTRIFQMHSTPIVKYDPKMKIVTIKHGGYKTVTTKSMINEVLRACGWPIQVYQDKKVWYVEGQKKIVFPAGGFIKLDTNGALVEPLLVTVV